MNIPLSEYWRLLNRYLVSQRGAALSMAVLLAVSTGLSLAAPQVLRSFIDSALTGAPTSLLIQASIGFFLIQLTKWVLNLLARYKVQKVAWTATNALRIDLMAHLVRLDLSFHKTHTPGELIERVDRDMEMLGVFLSNLVIELFGGGLLLIGILIAILIEDALLGALFCGYSLFSLVFLIWAQRFAPPHWRAERDCSAGFWGYMGEMLTATEDIQSCGAVQYALRRFVEYLRQWHPIKLRATIWGMIWLVTGVVYILGVALAWGVGGPMVRTGRLSLGTLFMIGYYLQWLVWGPIQAIQWQLEELQHAQVSIVRVQELLSTTSDQEDGTLNLQSGAFSIELDNVWFAYRDGVCSNATKEQADGQPSEDFVLRGVSCRVEAGRVLGLLGRTGSGKTTVARLLFRWYDPQEGEIRLDDVDMRQIRIEAIRKRIGLVTQDVMRDWSTHWRNWGWPNG